MVKNFHTKNLLNFFESIMINIITEEFKKCDHDVNIVVLTIEIKEWNKNIQALTANQSFSL